MVLCKACDRYLGLLRDDGLHPNQNGQDVNNLIIDFCKEPKSIQEIMDESQLLISISFLFNLSFTINTQLLPASSKVTIELINPIAAIISIRQLPSLLILVFLS